MTPCANGALSKLRPALLQKTLAKWTEGPTLPNALLYRYTKIIIHVDIAPAVGLTQIMMNMLRPSNDVESI